MSVSVNETLTAIAVKSGLGNSPIATATYAIEAASPVFSPGPGPYTSGPSVSISTSTAGAVIYYTTNGSTPTTSSTQYSSPVSVSVNTTINAIAVKAGLTNSPVANGVYAILVPTPTFSLLAGSYSSSQTVSISSAMAGATIRYTTNGSAPSESNGAVYSGPITISATTTLQAIAYASGYTDSGVASAVYTISATPPNITSVTPTSGTASTLVTVNGTGFGSTQGTGAVWLGSTPGTVSSWGNTQIIAAVAPSATSGNVLVQQGGVFSNAVAFTLTPTTTISSVTPNNGLPGTQVTISGTGFGSSQGTGQVWLGTAAASVQSWSDTQVVATVAAGSMSAQAQILQNGVFTSGGPFTVNIPHITNISPTSGPIGTSVTITGTSFGAVQGTGTLLLGSVAGTVTSWSDTQVLATVVSSASGVAQITQELIHE